MTKQCIIDSSSAILLYKGGIFEGLLDHYRAICPPAVITELTRNQSYPGAKFFLTCCDRKRLFIEYPDQIEIQNIHKRRNGLGAGEAECIALYNKKEGDFIILDDKKGAIFCQKENISYINALIVPKILFFCGFLSEEKYNTIFSLLLEKGRYSEIISRYVSDLQFDDLSAFLPVKD